MQFDWVESFSFILLHKWLKFVIEKNYTSKKSISYAVLKPNLEKTFYNIEKLETN